MPKVPGSISFLAIDFQGLDFLCLDKTCQARKGEQRKLMAKPGSVKPEMLAKSRALGLPWKGLDNH
jgi:hypothetical protein